MCDSHHINEDVLYATYHAAVEAMIEDAGALLEVIQTETEVEMQPRNKAAMDEVEQQIIELQERVLDLHKQKRAMKISDAYYNAQVNDAGSSERWSPGSRLSRQRTPGMPQ